MTGLAPEAQVRRLKDGPVAGDAAFRRELFEPGWVNRPYIGVEGELYAVCSYQSRLGHAIAWEGARSHRSRAGPPVTTSRTVRNPLITLIADIPVSAPNCVYQDAALLRSARLSVRALCIDEEGIVPVISVPQAFNEEELYVDLRSIFGHSLFLKCEGFNFAGSIKLKAATEMVEAAEPGRGC